MCIISPPRPFFVFFFVLEFSSLLPVLFPTLLFSCAYFVFLVCFLPCVSAGRFSLAGDVRERPGEADGTARGDIREEGEGGSHHRGKVRIRNIRYLLPGVA